MTLTTDELQKLLDAATQPDPTEWTALKAKALARNALDEQSPELARELIAARAKIAAAEKLAEALRDFATAKIDALRYQPAYGESPEDEPDPVVEADYVWALQADAKGAIAAWDAAA